MKAIKMARIWMTASGWEWWRSLPDSWLILLNMLSLLVILYKDSLCSPGGPLLVKVKDMGVFQIVLKSNF